MYPLVFDLYMNDCASGTENSSSSRKVMNQIQISGVRGSLKGCFPSGNPPPVDLTQDELSVSVLGIAQKETF